MRFFAFAFTMCLATDVLAQAPPEELQKILAGWEGRAQASSKVLYTVSSKVTVPQGAKNGDKSLFPGSYPDDVPPYDYQYDSDSKLLMDFAGGRVRFEERGQTFGGMKPVFRETSRILVFDGSQGSEYRPKAENPEIQELDTVVEKKPLSDKLAQLFFDRVAEILLVAHGFDPATALSGSSASGSIRLREAPAADGYVVAGRRSNESGEFIALRSSSTGRSTLELWVDPAQDSAIRRITRSMEDTVTEDVSIAVRQADCGWVPERIVIDRFGPRTGALLQHEEATIEVNCQPELLAEAFSLTPTAGAIVKEPDGDVVVLQGEGKEPISYREYEASRTTGESSRAWMIYLGVIVVGIALVTFAVRRASSKG